MNIVKFPCLIALALAIITLTANLAMAGESETTTKVRITAAMTVIEAEFNDSPAAREFITRLPLTLPMRRLHQREFYTVLDHGLPTQGQETHEIYELGDIAFWTRGDYFGILYSFDRPKMSAPIVKLGKVTSGLGIFEELDSRLEMRFELNND